MAAAAPLRARGLTVVRGPLTVLDSVDLVVAPGQRIGLVGPNGVGKSTLLQALAGTVPLESGAVERTPPTATVGYLPQEPSRSDVETVAIYLARRTGVTTATAELEAATVALAGDVDGTGDRYSVALDHWLSLGGGRPRRRASARSGPSWVCRRDCWSSRRRRCRVARRRGPGWPPCCSPASTCSCSTSRRTTSTSTASIASNAGSPVCARRWCW